LVRVLLVDDDAALRMLLRTTFEVFDIDVDEAEDATSARRLITGSAPDVVVLDVHMPGMDGLEFCRNLKTDPATDGIAVVMLSGSEGGTARAAEEAGADAAVRKPFSPLQLLAVVEQLAGSRYGIPFRRSSCCCTRATCAMSWRSRRVSGPSSRARTGRR
jgi:CheY-like chemotaxis protein